MTLSEALQTGTLVVLVGILIRVHAMAKHKDHYDHVADAVVNELLPAWRKKPKKERR